MPTWMNKDLLAKLNFKKRALRRWKQGQVTWDTVGACRNEVRKAKAHMELNLAKEMIRQKERVLTNASSAK